MTAVVTSPGMPSAIMVISAPPSVALFEDSGATMPSAMPVPNFFRVLGSLFGLVVGQDVGNRAAGAGQDSRKDADQGGAHEHGPMLQNLGDGLAVLDPYRLRPFGHEWLARPFGVLDVGKKLAEGEQPDQHGQECEALLQLIAAEGKACHTVDLVLADGGGQQPERPGDQALHHVGTGQAGGDGEREQDKREKIPGPEFEPDAGQLRRQCHQDDRPDEAAEERRPHPDAKGQTGPTLARHWKAVEGGGDRGRRARNSGQHARHQTPRKTADQDADHGRKPLYRGHGEGERQGEDNRHGDGKARDGAGDETGGDADEHQPHRLQVEDRLDGAGDVVDQQGAPPTIRKKARPGAA